MEIICINKKGMTLIMWNKETWTKITSKLNFIIKDREASIDSYYDMFYRGEINEDEYNNLCNLQERELEKNRKALNFSLHRIRIL